MPEHVVPLRVKLPCDDEREFHARLARIIAENGLRIPTARERPVGTRLRVALEFRDGAVLRGEAVVDAHVQVNSRPGVNVRFVTLEGGSSGGPSPDPLEGPQSPPETLDVASADPLEASSDVIAASNRRVALLQRSTIALAALAMVVAGGGYALARHAGLGVPRDGLLAAHLGEADRLLAEGRAAGDDGALGHLLAAKRLAPDDPATGERLSALADMFEVLGARALERDDLAVASIHLESARLAAPERESIHALLAALDRRKQPAVTKQAGGGRAQRKRGVSRR